MSKALTDAAIRNVIPPPTGRLELADAGCRGLWLRITPNGARSFAFRFRDPSSGASARFSIGRYPDVSLRDARTRADDLRREVAAGKNPSTVRRTASERSFKALADRYLAEHARRFKRSADADEQALRVHVLPVWGRRDYTTIERADVIKLVERIIARGTPVAANRVQALISSVFSFALDAGLVKSHPCLRLRKRGQERAKSRVLSDDETRLFWERAGQSPVSPGLGLALRLALVLGCRPGEVAGMTKAELEFDGKGRAVAWLIPAERAKNGRPHLVPLPPLAGDIITEARALAGDEPFVFPSRTVEGSIAGHALTVAMRRLGLALPKDAPGADTWRADPPTPHDLRRSVATRLSALGTPSEDIAAVLGHVRGDVTSKHYDTHQRANEKRQALTRWSATLAAIMKPPAGANVVALKRRR